MQDVGCQPCCSSSSTTYTPVPHRSSLCRHSVPSFGRRSVLTASRAPVGQRRPLSVSVQSAAQPDAQQKYRNNFKPKYNKYRTRADIERDLVREWKETTGRDGVEEPLTPATALAYVPTWLKYNVVPELLRYAVWVVWVRVQAVLQVWRKMLVLRGAKLDVWLAQQGAQRSGRATAAAAVTVPRCRVLQRWHGKVPLLEDFKFRFRLYMGQETIGLSTA